MSQSVVAKRYAKAFFEIASEQNLLNEFDSDLGLVSEMFAANPKLTSLLQTPTLGNDAKKKLLATSFAQQHTMTKHLLFLLIDRHRIELIEEIYIQYHQLKLEAHSEVEAKVASAFHLTPEDEMELIQVFQKITGKTIRVDHHVDPDLLGGIIVQIGDRVYDGSLRTQLKRFQTKLKNSHVG